MTTYCQKYNPSGGFADWRRRKNSHLTIEGKLFKPVAIAAGFILKHLKSRLIYTQPAGIGQRALYDIQVETMSQQKECEVTR